ncbi:hypothetical protein HOC13_00495 [Candidatus Woesearchaeota archaeon]|nr:hypothetical protein [Candidatus Woesearchaeota archaeon]
MENSIDYQLETMTQKYESPDIYDNVISHRGTIGYHALSFAVKASQLGDESLLGKALDLVRDYTSLNGMIMPNNLPAELYVDLTFKDFKKRTENLRERERVEKWETLGTVKRTNNFKLTHF